MISQAIYSDAQRGTLYELSLSNSQGRCATLSRLEYAKLETAALAHVDDNGDRLLSRQRSGVDAARPRPTKMTARAINELR